VKLFKDSFKIYPDRFPMEKHRKYKLWLALVRKAQVLTNDDYIEIFPEMKEKAEVWEECLDY